MEQLNQVLPEPQEEKKLAAAVSVQRMEPPLLIKLRQKFEITGLVSLIFGVMFAFSFYDARIGLNAFFFTGVMIILLNIIMKKFELPIKNGTKAYYAAALLLGLSTMLTSSMTLQFLNTVATIILLNISLLHQLHEDRSWDFLNYISKMFGMLFLGIAAIPMPFVDGTRYLKNTKTFRNEKVLNVLLGVIIAIPLLLIITALLSSADLLFGDMTKNMFEFLFSTDILGVLIMVAFGFFSCYLILCGAATQTREEVPRKAQKAEASIACTIMGLICLVYLMFCGLQVVYLFAGGVFTLPEGYTFAEYARKGFFELLAVAIINILLMLVFTTFFVESRTLRFLLTLMSGCTYIMIISAAYRMLLYIASYHLTFLRLFVLLALFIIALILAGVIVSVYRREFPLFRYVTAVIVVCYLIFSFARPDYWIAAYYEKQEAVISLEDARYLVYDLSPDATPVVLPLLSERNRFTADPASLAEEYNQRLKDLENRGVRDYNVAASQAVKCAGGFQQ